MAKGQNIIPLGDKVLIEPERKDDKKTKSGIIIPETVDKERPEKGKVIAVGRGKITEHGELIPLQVRKGQTVIFSKYSPEEIKIDGVIYYLLSESQILAVIE